MRSRYAAYAVGDADYVFATWHPRTRPATIELDADVTWTGLTVHDAGEDWVDFTATFHSVQGAGEQRAGELRERSRFERRAGRWVYVDGDVG